MSPELEIPAKTIMGGTQFAFPATRGPAQWNPTRIGFRFVFAYFVFYWVSLLSGPLMERYGFVDGKPRPAPGLSGQVRYESRHDLRRCCHRLSFPGIRAGYDPGLVPDELTYEKLERWLRLVLRVGLGAFLILYGGMKVIQAQMPPPALSTLTETYGQSSPMHLLWTFMGASRGYNAFAGGSERLAGSLLFVPMFTTIGA